MQWRKKLLNQSTKNLSETTGSRHLVHAKKFQKKNYGSIISHLPKSTPILDLGFGWNASFLSFLQDNGFSNLSGVDLDQGCIDRAIEILGKDVTLHLDDVVSFIESCKNKYGLIVMKHVLEHIPKQEGLKTMERMYELLLPGGMILIEVPNMHNEIGRLTYYEDITHETFFTSRVLRQTLVQADYVDIYPIRYPLINLGSVRLFIGSFVAKCFAKLVLIKSWLIARPLGMKGPFTPSILGVFRKNGVLEGQ